MYQPKKNHSRQTQISQFLLILAHFPLHVHKLPLLKPPKISSPLGLHLLQLAPMLLEHALFPLERIRSHLSAPHLTLPPHLLPLQLQPLLQHTHLQLQPLFTRPLLLQLLHQLPILTLALLQHTLRLPRQLLILHPHLLMLFTKQPVPLMHTLYLGSLLILRPPRLIHQLLQLTLQALYLFADNQILRPKSFDFFLLSINLS